MNIHISAIIVVRKRIQPRLGSRAPLALWFWLDAQWSEGAFLLLYFADYDQVKC